MHLWREKCVSARTTTNQKHLRMASVMSRFDIVLFLNRLAFDAAPEAV